ncbi:MAG: ABC transporter permease, partial [Dysgonamonadaceae bacterium]|nr:ABC transporter permease [Dysgonamonadaceae bacterium]
MGTSWFTSNPESTDLAQRFPATLELITLTLIMALIIGITSGILMAIKPTSIWDKFIRVYSLLAGSMPEFWMGLLFIYVLYVKLAVVPPPLGRLDILVSPPTMITGFYTIDSILTGNWQVLWSSIAQLFLPVFTLGLCFSGPIMKMTSTVMKDAINADYVWYARACGLSEGKVLRYILKNGLTPVITFVGILYGFLLGGATLIEQVFGWGGFGQYGIQAVINKDYLAIQGHMLVAALFCM